MRIKDLIKIEIEESEKDNFKRDIIIENISRGNIMAKVILGFEFFFAIVDICEFLFKVDNQSFFNYYLAMYLLLILICVVYLLFIKAVKDLNNKSISQLRKLELILVIFVTLLCSWSSVLSLMDQKAYGHLMVFMVNLIGVSVLYL